MGTKTHDPMADRTRARRVGSDSANYFAILSGECSAWALDAKGELIDLAERKRLVAAKEILSLVDGPGGESMRFTGTASSNVKDRQGDVLDTHCQASMLAQVPAMTAWLNHDYDIPEDVLGKNVGADLVQRNDERGEVLDLDVVTEIDHENPRAVKVWKSVQGGIRIGLSIGGIFTDLEVVDYDDGSWGLNVHDLVMLEYSGCGIPANPRAYSKYLDPLPAFGATKGIRRKMDPIVATLGLDRLRLPATRFALAKSFTGDRGAQKELAMLVGGTSSDAAADVVASVLKVAQLEELGDAAPTVVDVDAAVREAQYEGAAPEAVSDDVAGGDAIAEALASGDHVAGGGADGSGDSSQGAADASGEADAVTGAQPAAVQAAESPAAVADGSAVSDVVPVRSPVEPETPENAVDAPVVPDQLALDAEALATRAALDDNGDANADELSPIEDDAPKQRRVVKAMRAVKRMSDHGLCTESMGHAMKAHAAMKSLLPDGYDLPANARMPGDDGEGADADADAAARSQGVVDARAAQLAAIEAKAVDAKASLDAANAALAAATQKCDEARASFAELETRKATLTNGVVELETKLRELQETPLGRRTAADSSGIRTNGHSATVPVAIMQRSTAQLTEDLGNAMIAAERGRPL